jgi:type II secretory pathway pseudopilin PulG
MARNWHWSVQMKKEVLKGFSLLAVIIVLALMTAVAAVSANSPTTAEESYAAVSR